MMNRWATAARLAATSAGALRFAAAGLAGLLAIASGASAAGSAAGVYYDSATALCGVDAQVCVVKFTAVPPGKVAVIDRVSCRIGIFLPSTAGVDRVTIGRLAGNATATPRGGTVAPLTLMHSDAQVKVYNLNAETMDVVLPAERPSLTLSMWDVATEALDCNISGVLKP